MKTIKLLIAIALVSVITVSCKETPKPEVQEEVIEVVEDAAAEVTEEVEVAVDSLAVKVEEGVEIIKEEINQ
tara:strand:- start:5141 stop:5356 length:216 start_codon:yes stop_codon:yes gene_type:complete